MEKRQAIEFLEYLRQDRNLEKTIYGDALNIAIGALKAQLSQEGTTSDLISRQAAIDALMNNVTPYGLIDDDGNIESGCKDKDVVEMLYNLPPAQPEPQEGHWINGKCDLCGEHAPFWAMASTYHESKYCPNCGAKMKGERQK